MEQQSGSKLGKEYVKAVYCHLPYIVVNKRVWNAVLGCNLKNDRMIFVHFQGKPFYITVIQIYAPTSNTEAEVEQFYEDLQDLLEHPKKMSFSL